MTMAAAKTAASDSIFLAIREDSDLAKLLKRLAGQPAIATSEVAKILTQQGREGRVEASPTRASYVMDLLANAVHGLPVAPRVRKGVVAVRGIADALRTDKPGHKLDAIVERKVEIVEAPKAPEAKGGQGHVEADVQGAGGKPVKVEGEIKVVPGGKDVVGDVVISFPETPAVREPKAGFVEPTWYKRMSAKLDRGEHVMIKGPPGGGKSTAPEVYFARKGQPFVVVNGEGGLRSRHLAGSVELSNGSTRFVTAEYAAAAIFGWGCIINEVNAAEPDALLFINGQLEVPNQINLHGRSYPVHPDFRLICTYNPGLAGTKPLPPAFVDRFHNIKLGFPARDHLLAMVRANTDLKNRSIAPSWMGTLLDFAQEVWGMHERGVLRYQITPRRLFDAVDSILADGLSPRAALVASVLDTVDAVTDREQIRNMLNLSKYNPGMEEKV